MNILPLIHASLFLNSLGLETTAKNIINVFNSASQEVSETELNLYLDSVSGMNMDELIEQAQTAQVVQAPVQQSSTPVAEEEEQQEEIIEEEEEDSGLGSLFDF